jgi:hypothetical protein
MSLLRIIIALFGEKVKDFQGFPHDIPEPLFHGSVKLLTVFPRWLYFLLRRYEQPYYIPQIKRDTRLRLACVRRKRIFVLRGE